ncbi:major facilitator superfamily domain-containing protein [Mycena floridula]|nr:major facilitator superfamily domain-containing protein [Mycena floridula]
MLTKQVSTISSQDSESIIKGPNGPEIEKVEQLQPIEESEEADVGYVDYRRGLETELTPEEVRRIRWKIDLWIMPIFTITQLLQFVDKTALNYANLFGFRTALDLTGFQFNVLAGVVYIGYFIGQYPAAYLIGRYRAERVLSIALVLWGICVITMAQCTNFSNAMANRFILGLFESAVTPGLTLMTGFWYTRQEIPLRQYIWYSALGWGGLVGSYVSTGIAAISPTAPGPEKWQYIFYILGAVTLAWTAVVYFLLSDSPSRARFLTPEERILAVKRVASNQIGIKNKNFKKDQIYISFMDPKTLILFVSIFAAAIPNGVLSSFSTQIISEMGFSTTKTTVLKSVGDMLQIVALFIGGYITLNYNNMRLIMSTAANIICTVAAACTGYLPEDRTWMRLVAFWFTNFQSVGFATSLVMISSNMGGYTHRTIASFMMFTAYTWGNFTGPFVVKQSEAPRFPTAMAGLLAGYAIKLVCQVILLGYLIWFNKRRDRIYGPPNEVASREAGMQDKTEYENTDFRYVY